MKVTAHSISVDAKRKRRRSVRLALALLALGAGVACFFSVWQGRRNAALASRSFDELAARTVAQVQRRLHTYEYGLRGARGAMVSAGVDQINRRRFRDYSDTRDIEKEFPGARGMGLIRRVPASDELRFLSAARLDDKPDFTIRSLSAHTGDRYVIQYIEPLERNLQSVGLDIASESNRRAAAEGAMQTGMATLTAPITLVQATGKPLHSFLFLLPVYAPGARHSTAEERAAATVGWSFAPLLIDEVLADFELGDDFSLALRDVTALETAAFFATPGHERPAASGLGRRLPIQIYGRVWQAELKATPAFVARLNLFTANSVAAAGLAIAALLSFLSFSYAQSRQRETQVRAEQARRAAIVESTNDAVIGETLEGIVTDWNHGAELLFGYSVTAALGQPAASLILPTDRAVEDAEIRAAMAKFSLEVVDPGTKRGRGTNRTPFEIATSAASGKCPEDEQLWVAYCEGMRGAKMLTWSDGLRAAVELDGEQSDQDAADSEERQEAETVAVIPGKIWDAIRDRPQMSCAIVEAAELAVGEAGAFTAIQDLLWGRGELKRRLPGDGLS